MSALVEDLGMRLGTIGNAEVLNSIYKLASLDGAYRNAIVLFLTECDKADTAELASAVALLAHSNLPSEDTSTAHALYASNNGVVHFIRTLRGMGPIDLSQDDTVTVRIENPSVDIVTGSVNNTSAYTRAVFLVTLSVTGFGCTIQFRAQACVDDYNSKDHEMWLVDMITECKEKWAKRHYPFSSGTTILGGYDLINNLIDDPCETNAHAVKSYFMLARYFFGDFQRYPGSYNSAQVQKYVDYIVRRLSAMYYIQQSVNTQLVDSLIELVDLLGFVHTSDCLVVSNVCKPKNNELVILSKSGTGWTRENKGCQAYKRIKLSEKLQQ